MEDEEFYVERTLKFPAPVSGKAIKEAVEKIAKEPRIKEHDVDGIISYELGQNSRSSSEDIQIVHADGNVFNTDSMYESVMIKWHGWPGIKYAVMTYQEDVVRDCEAFRDKLKEEIVVHEGES
jgi:hypothetical protein